MSINSRSNFWNNWDFKTILMVIQLITVIWIVAATYAKLDAKVEEIDRVTLREIKSLQDELVTLAKSSEVLKIERRLEKLEDYLLNNKPYRHD